MNEKESLHERLQLLVEFAPMIKSLYPTDVVVSISDREKIILELPSKLVPIENNLGRILTNQDPMVEAMQFNKRVSLEIPKEAYGYAMRTNISPITDEKGVVIGSIAVTTSLDNQMNLIQVAEHLASSSEEISASTEELASSASDMKNQMNFLIEAHQEMHKKMNQTGEILEIINSIAQSSRMLGLNAGIEAARSGEHGRGFSIVAQEIAKLANRSTDSVEQIRSLLNSVKEQVQSVADIVNQTVVIADQQSTATNEIADAIQNLADVATDVEELSRKI